jgi:NAD(P)-dependent dehydrogenase (short-subunit alcohol dehydrogenase family)
MNILITGTTGLAEALKKQLQTHHLITCVSRRTGHNILNIQHWAPEYFHYDVCINCAYDQWQQIAVLETFYHAWKDNAQKQIINIGSALVDYTRIEVELEHQYMPYRIHKQALQSTFYKLVKQAKCDIKLINPGAIDTPMIQHIDYDNKMSPESAAEKIVDIMSVPCFKKVDLWQ